jgi:hypothetical protein
MAFHEFLIIEKAQIAVECEEIVARVEAGRAMQTVDCRLYAVEKFGEILNVVKGIAEVTFQRIDLSGNRQRESCPGRQYPSPVTPCHFRARRAGVGPVLCLFIV